MLTLSNIREHTANSASAHAHTGWGWVVALTAKTKASATKRYNDIQQEHKKKTTSSHHAGRKRMQFDHPQPPTLLLSGVTSMGRERASSGHSYALIIHSLCTPLPCRHASRPKCGAGSVRYAIAAGKMIRYLYHYVYTHAFSMLHRLWSTHIRGVGWAWVVNSISARRRLVP